MICLRTYIVRVPPGAYSDSYRRSSFTYHHADGTTSEEKHDETSSSENVVNADAHKVRREIYNPNAMHVELGIIRGNGEYMYGFRAKRAATVLFLAMMLCYVYMR